MHAAALGIEILCIMSAEVGENIGLYTFGFNLHGIAIAYILGYALAGFSTFMTILGRYDFNSNDNKIDGCCSFLEQNSNKGFFFNLLITFQNFKKGFEQLIHNRNNPKTKYIFKTSIIILVTAESACIVTAETAGRLFYQSSLLQIQIEDKELLNLRFRLAELQVLLPLPQRISWLLLQK